MGLFNRRKDRERSEPQVSAPEPVSEDNSLAVQIAEKRAAKTEADRLKKFLGVSLGFNVFFLIIVLCVSYWGMVAKRDIYFAATADGRIQRLVPLDKPYVSEAEMMNWVTQVITETYTMDFHNYKKSLARVQPAYSQGAWKELLEQIKPMVESVVDNRLMLFAVADEAPRLLTQGLYTKDLYAWKVEFPMIITHQTTEGTQTYRWLVQAVVARADVGVNSAGVEIIQFIIQPR